MDWKYHFTTYLDPVSGQLKLQEKGIAQFPGTKSELENFLLKSREIAFYWRGMELDIFPIRNYMGVMSTDIHPTEHEEARIKRDRENLCSWMVE